MIIGMPTRTSGWEKKRVLLVAAGAVLLLAPLIASAQGAGVAGSVNNAIASVVGIALSFLHVATWVVFVLLITLLDPYVVFFIDTNADATTDSVLLEKLNEIWQLSRDLMNVGIAIGLIIMAIIVIVTANKDSVYGPLKKLIIAAVLVNFSWFIPLVVVDLSNAVATTIYNLPSAVSNNQTQCTYKTKVEDNPSCVKGDADGLYTCKCQMLVDAEIFVDEKDLAGLEARGYTCKLGTVLCYATEDLDLTKTSGFAGILNGLVINHARLETLSNVPARGAQNDDVKAMFSFILWEVLILGIHIALFVPLLAMLTVFIIRIPVLWITMAFMPFYFIGSLVPEQFGGAAGELSKKLLKWFLQAAFLPAIVAVPLSVGFILINVGIQLPTPNTPININLLDQISNSWQMLWLVIAVGVLWVGVFSALNLISFSASITGKIQSAGKAYGTVGAKALAGSIPIPGVGSALSAAKTLSPGNLSRAIDIKNQPLSLSGPPPPPPVTPANAGNPTTVKVLLANDGLRNDIQAKINLIQKETDPAKAKKIGDELIRDLRDRLSVDIADGDYRGLNEALKKIEEEIKKTPDFGKGKFEFNETSFKNGLKISS